MMLKIILRWAFNFEVYWENLSGFSGLNLKVVVLNFRVYVALPNRTFCVSFVFFFFLSWNIWLFLWTVHGVHCSWIHKFQFSATFSLKMGPKILFLHLKIILLQYFSVFSFSFQFSVVFKRILSVEFTYRYYRIASIILVIYLFWECEI